MSDELGVSTLPRADETWKLSMDGHTWFIVGLSTSSRADIGLGLARVPMQ